MPTWPASLPQDALVGVAVSAGDSVLRSQMDAGPPTRRNRFTANTVAITTSMVLTGTQVATLDTFFHDTLSNGALSFDWKDPRTDAAAVIAFTAPPKYAGIVGDPMPGDRLWRASLSLEIQP